MERVEEVVLQILILPNTFSDIFGSDIFDDFFDGFGGGRRVADEDNLKIEVRT